MSYKVTAENPKITLNESETVKAVLQNVQIILVTPKGSVPLYREFGLNMNFIDKPFQIARTLLIAAVTEAIQEFEPRAEIVNITFAENQSDGKLNPIVEVEINA
jgi:phage baseplate assembly protein W